MWWQVPVVCWCWPSPLAARALAALGCARPGLPHPRGPAPANGGFSAHGPGSWKYTEQGTAPAEDPQERGAPSCLFRAPGGSWLCHSSPHLHLCTAFSRTLPASCPDHTARPPLCTESAGWGQDTSSTDVYSYIDFSFLLFHSHLLITNNFSLEVWCIFFISGNEQMVVLAQSKQEPWQDSALGVGASAFPCPLLASPP